MALQAESTTYKILVEELRLMIARELKLEERFITITFSAETYDSYDRPMTPVVTHIEVKYNNRRASNTDLDR